MTVERKYSCDLCRATLRELVGIHFTDFPAGFREAPVLEVEHHLCDLCLESAAKLWETVKSNFSKAPHEKE